MNWIETYQALLCVKHCWASDLRALQVSHFCHWIAMVLCDLPTAVSHARKLPLGDNHFTGHYWLSPYLYWPNFYRTFTRLSKRHFCSLMVAVDQKFDSEPLLFSTPRSKQASDDSKNFNRYWKRVRFPETFNLLWDHLALCNLNIASGCKKRGVWIGHHFAKAL